MEYLLDTDWAIDHLNGVQRTINGLERFLPSGVGISIVSLAEIYEGIYGSRNVPGEERAFQRLLELLEIVEIDSEICRIFARERRRLRSIGALIGDFDLLIGATAIHHNLTLLTGNRRHFGRIDGLSIFSV